MKLLTYKFSREWKELEIYPLNDLHVGDSHTDLKLFESFKNFILEKENRFIILNGDLMNNAVKSSVSNVYTETMSPRDQKKWLIENLRPLKDRILAITTGNHEARSKKETDTDLTEDIAIALGLEDRYSENGNFIKISFGKLYNKNDKYCTYILHNIHGSCGGKQIGSAVNSLENYGMIYEGIDIFIMGHVHGRNINRSSKIIIDPRNDNIIQRDVLYVISSAWQEYGGYAQKSMLRPRTKGKTPIILDGRTKDFYGIG